MNNSSSSVPNFIQLFAIRRIIGKYTLTHPINDLNTLSQELDNLESQQVAQKLLSQLVGGGVKLYMKKYYNKNKQSLVIESIMNKIIFVKFAKEYNQLINCKLSKDNDYYQRLVFNAGDVMCNIFQYLQYGIGFNQCLFNCSLVNIQWLFHSWNVNSVYCIDLTKLIGQTFKISQSNNNINNNILRMWNRLVKAKYLYVHWYEHTDAPVLWDRMRTLKHVEKIDGHVYGAVGLQCMYNIMNIYKEKLKSNYSYISYTPFNRINIRENVLQPLTLVNAVHIQISSLHFYIKWSKTCKKLDLGYGCGLEYLSKNWCNYVIKNVCFCSSEYSAFESEFI